jgi:hypothetical protein
MMLGGVGVSVEKLVRLDAPNPRPLSRRQYQCRCRHFWAGIQEGWAPSRRGGQVGFRGSPLSRACATGWQSERRRVAYFGAHISGGAPLSRPALVSERVR